MLGANCAAILRQELHYLETDRNERPLESCHLGVAQAVSKMISRPMVCLAQTLQLSCSDTNTISERTETSFHLSPVT
jgi:hypothetical protein